MISIKLEELEIFSTTSTLNVELAGEAGRGFLDYSDYCSEERKEKKVKGEERKKYFFNEFYTLSRTH